MAGPAKVVPLFKQANEFEEDEGFSIITEDELEDPSSMSLDELVSSTEEGKAPAKKQKAPKKEKRKGPQEWSIDDQWFITKPRSVSGEIGPSLKYRIGKGLDLVRGRERWGSSFRIWIDGKPLKHARTIGKSRPASPGQAFYSYSDGLIIFPEGSEGKEFRVDYYKHGEKGEFEFQTDPQEEYDSVRGLKKRSQNLWEHLLSHPDPEFVRDTLIPTIEDELDHLREAEEKRPSGDPDSIPDLTGEMMTLEQLLYRMDDDDSAFSKADMSFPLDSEFVEFEDIDLPVGTELRSLSYSDSDEKLRAVDEDPDQGEFVNEGDALLFNEGDLGRKIRIDFNKPSNAKELTSRFIQEKIAPKLEGLHSLAHLLAEQVYDLQSQGDDEDLEGIPGLEGGRVLDPQFLRYVQRVRGESNKLESDLIQFARFHMPKLAKIIQAGYHTYFLGKPVPSPKNPKERSKLDEKEKKVFKQSIKPIFEKAGLDITALEKVALNAFRQGVLEFDYEKRDKTKTPNAEDFRIVSNPRLWTSVATSLKSLFERYREEQTQELEFSGDRTITIPNGGGKVNLEEKGILPSSVKVTSEDGKPFAQGGGHRFVAGPGRGNRSWISLLGTTADGKQSPWTKRKFGKSTGAVVTDSEGNEFRRISKLSEVKNTTDRVFYLTTSDNRGISLPASYEGETFTVVISGKGAVDADGLLSKNRYTVDGNKGTLEFSPQNGGQKVRVEFQVKRRTSRQVNPSMKSTGDEDSAGQDIMELSTEGISEEGMSPEEMISKEITRDNATKILDVIEQVLYDSDEHRLDLKDRALLLGLFGIGMPNGERLSIREIAEDEPFNIDLSTPKGRSEVSKLRTQFQPQAASKLVEILKERLADDPAMQSIMKSRAFNKVLFEGDKATDRDKVLRYIKENFSEEDDPTVSVRRFLDSLLVRRGGDLLSDEEENILRWMWSLPGTLRGEGREQELKSGEPTPMELMIAEEFLEDDELKDPKKAQELIKSLMPQVQKAYDRALSKFEGLLDDTLQKMDLKKFDKIPGAAEFIKTYRQQRDRETFRELVTEDEQARDPKPRVEKPQPRVPLFDRIKESGNFSDEKLLRDILTELDKAQKQGKDLSFLMREREKTTKDLSATDQKSAEELLEQWKESRQGLVDVSQDLKALSQEKKEALQAIRSSADEETQKAISTAISERKSEDEAVSSAARDTLKKLLTEARGKAPADVRKRLTDAAKEEKKLRADLKEFQGLVSRQKEELDKLHASPAFKAQKELDLMGNLQKFFTYNDEFDIGGGKYNLAHLFEVTKFKKGPGYKAPKWEPPAEGEEDYRPKSRGLPPVSRTIKKPSWTPGRDDPKPAEDGKEPKKRKPTFVRPEPEESRQPRPIKKITRKRSLFDQLLSFAFPPHGEEKPNERVEDVAQFRLLMDRMQAFVTRGHGTVDDFVANPSALPAQDLQDRLKPRIEKRISEEKEALKKLEEELGELEEEVADAEDKGAAEIEVDKHKRLIDKKKAVIKALKKRLKSTQVKSKTLVDEKGVLGRVRQFLNDHASDIQTAEGNWDLTKLHKAREFKPSEIKIDKTPGDENVEALQNSQNLSMGEANVLHSVCSLLHEGKTIKGLIEKMNLGGVNQLVLGRLRLYMRLHPEIRDGKKWDFSKLYSGEDRLPSAESARKTLPLSTQMNPLVQSLEKQQFASDESDTPEEKKRKKNRDGGESPAQIRAKIDDLLERMGDLAAKNYDLEKMQDHFLEMDQGGNLPYSLSYLFQNVRNFLHRLNRTRGLQNMENNYGLDDLFPEGAPLEDPADTETTPAPPEKDTTGPEVDENPPGFQKLVDEQKLSDAEARVALQLLQSIQLRAEDSGKSVGEIIAPLRERPNLRPILNKILRYIGSHKDEIMSDIPGYPDFSSLTGVPFNPPDVSSDEEEAQQEQEQAEQPAPQAPVTTKVKEPAAKPSTTKVDMVTERLQGLPEGEQEKFVTLLSERNMATPEEIYQAVMNAGLGPKQVLKLRSLVDHEEEGMGFDMPTPKEHGIREEELPSEKQAPIADPAKPKGKRGRLSKELTSREMNQQQVQQILSEADPTEEEQALLDEYVWGWDTASSYGALMALGKEAKSKIAESDDKKAILKAWKRVTRAWLTFLLQAPTQQVEAPAAAPAPAQQPAPQAPKAPEKPQVNLDALRDRAIALSRENNLTADQFGAWIQANKPELMEAYESIKPAVKQALEATPQQFQFDLSDVIQS